MSDSAKEMEERLSAELRRLIAPMTLEEIKAANPVELVKKAIAAAELEFRCTYETKALGEDRAKGEMRFAVTFGGLVLQEKRAT